jgi:hypothetical protein
LKGRDEIEEFPFSLIGFATFDGEHVLLGRYGDFIGGETGQRQRYLVPVVRQAFDVAGWVIVVAGGVLGSVDQVEKAVEADS